MTTKKLFTPWSSLNNMLGKLPAWWPAEEQPRIAAYEKYDQMYWNDPTQYAIRILEGEQPIYIPNARTIVDTTAHYLMKGLTVNTPSKDPNNPQEKFLLDFFKREKFYSKFHTGKTTGIARGDWAFHITADPAKLEGERVSIELLHPGMVWKVPDSDDPDKIVRIHIVTQWIDPDDEAKGIKIRKLTYEKVVVDGKRRIGREEAIWKLTPDWFGPRPEKVKQILKPDLLPEEIDHFPVYWYNNIEWDSQVYGSSELRGLEYLSWAVSQGATDTQMALALEGLGVFATDGGRPVDDAGVETDWEVAPGKVMEVPAGSYFRRVDGVGSITPMQDQIKYIEQKMFEASSITDVARGIVDVQVAQSGIALALRFQPTLAKIEQRDLAGVEITQQMFYDLTKWFHVYEGVTLPELTVDIAKQKLPENRTDKLNELNNMFDRKIISRKYYRTEMAKLGYIIPENMDAEILKEARQDAKINQLKNPVPPPDPQAGTNNLPPGSNPNNGSVDKQPNKSNNRSRPNESSGTESGQTARRQSQP
jgi:hypothetical protein